MTFSHADLRQLNRACTLGSGHRTVLLTIATYMDQEGQAWPSRKTLADDAGLSERRFREIVKDLVEAGFLKVEDEAGRVVYCLQKLPKKGGEISPAPGEISPAPGEISPKSGGISPKSGGISPGNGEISPILLYKGKNQEEPRRTKEACNAGAGATGETFVDEDEVVTYRGSRQPLARLAWAEKLAKAQVEAVGIRPTAGAVEVAELRTEWQAFLVGMAERARAHQAPMLRVDAAASRLREIVQGGGVGAAVEAVRYAIVSGAAWPVPRPTGNRFAQAKVSATTSTVGAYDDAI